MISIQVRIFCHVFFMKATLFHAGYGPPPQSRGGPGLPLPTGPNVGPGPGSGIPGITIEVLKNETLIRYPVFL